MVAAAGADELIHVGVAAVEAAVHDADRLAPQERRPAVAGLTGKRGCHDAVRSNAEPRVTVIVRGHWQDRSPSVYLCNRYGFLTAAVARRILGEGAAPELSGISLPAGGLMKRASFDAVNETRLVGRSNPGTATGSAHDPYDPRVRRVSLRPRRLVSPVVAGQRLCGVSRSGWWVTGQRVGARARSSSSVVSAVTFLSGLLPDLTLPAAAPRAPHGRRGHLPRTSSTSDWPSVTSERSAGKPLQGSGRSWDGRTSWGPARAWT